MAERQAKRDEVDAELRRQIADGVYGPGTPLPTRERLAQRLGVSAYTVHQVLKRLEAEGFLVPGEGRGTEVAPAPPPRARYALAFPPSPGFDGHPSRFWKSLERAARRRAAQEPNRRFVFFNDVAAGNAEGARLRREIEAHRLAGVIFPSYRNLVREAIPGAAELPLVGVGERSAPAEDFLRVSVDRHAFLDRAFERLAGRGASDAAVLTGLIGEPHTAQREAPLHAQRHGVLVPSYWIQGLNPAGAAWSDSIVELLFGEHARARPQGLVIDDDHLVEPVTRALDRLELPERERPAIAAHTNFVEGTAAPSASLHRVGYDVEEVLDAAVDAIDRARAGRPVSPVTLIAPLTAEEHAARVSA